MRVFHLLLDTVALFSMRDKIIYFDNGRTAVLSMAKPQEQNCEIVWSKITLE